MLERDYLMIQYLSKEIINSRMELLKGNLVEDRLAEKGHSFFMSMLNLIGIMALSFVVILVTG